MVWRTLAPPGPSGPGAPETIAAPGNPPHPVPAAGSGRRRYAQGMRRIAAPGGSLLVAALAAAFVVGACATPIPQASFDPASACTTDGRFPGAFPELEALLPTTFEGKAPTSVDSGRNCTPTALGTLAQDGVDGVRFAGATWALGGTTGVTVAVFEGDGLDAATLRTFYENGARKARRTEKLVVSDTTVGGNPAKRLDVLGSDGTGQTVVTWPASEPGRVNVLLAADLGDAKVLEALDAFAAP